ncbi:MAG: ferredoxin [Acidimicrobiales bacterium]
MKADGPAQEAPATGGDVDRRAAGAFRVVVDRDLCQGHAVCESETPGVFSVSKKGELSILIETPTEDRRTMVEAAVRECPTHALRIEELGS